MKVFFGVVVCVLINSRRIVTSLKTGGSSTSYKLESKVTLLQTPTIDPDLKAYDESNNCTNPGPPKTQSISIGKTFANITWLTNQTDTECTPTQLQVICLAPEEENKYGLGWVKNGSLVTIPLNQSSTTFSLIEDLSEFTNYTCNGTLVFSNNESSTTQFRFQTKEEVSSHPLNLTVNNVKDRSFAITWQQPAKNPGVFKVYHIQILNQGANYSVIDGCVQNSTNFSQSTTDESYIFSDALPNYKYKIIVFAENSAGNSSGTSDNTITSTSPSDQPRKVNISSLVPDPELDGTIGNLTWKMPCQTNGPIKGFNISLEGNYTLNSSIQDVKTIFVNATGSVDYFQIIKLMAATKYMVSVRADGDSEMGNFYSINFSTEDNVPTAPIIQNIKSGPNDLIVSWSEPKPLAGNITKYKVEITALEPLYNYDPVRCPLPNKTFSDSLDGSVTTYNFTNLRPYYNYSISVTAFTSKGPGNSSRTSAQTNSSVPEKPENFEFDINEDNKTGILSWTTPCNINGPILNFTLSITGIYTDDSSIVTNDTFMVKYEDMNFNYTYEVALQEAYYYHVNISIVLVDGTNGKYAEKNLTTPDGYPGTPNITNIVEIDANSFTLVWEPPSARTGRIQYYQLNISSQGPLYETDCDIKSGSYVFIIAANDTMKHKFIDGKPYFNYSVSIQANTSRGFGNSSETFVVTNQSVPENVRTRKPELFISTSEKYEAYVHISFEKPCFLNGPLKYFELNMVGKRDNFEDDLQYLHNRTTSDDHFKCYLKPAYHYTFNITTWNEGFANTTGPDNFLAPAGVPSSPTTIPADFNLETDSSSAVITLKREYFNEVNGKIKYLALILSDQNVTGGYFDRYMEGIWPEVNNTETHIYNQLTKDWWMPFNESHNELSQITFHLGSQMECESTNYCNKPLEPNKEYYLIVRVFTDNFFRNWPTIYFKTEDISKLGVILGIIFGLLIFSLFGIVAFYVWRKNMMKLPPIFYPKNSHSKPSPPNTAIPIPKFPQYCKQLENNPEKITEQYALLTEKTKEAVRMHTTVYAELTENRRKNRYTNILPYDETRVKLLMDEDDEIGSDYINASYIKGYSGKVEYIATQGPLPTTCRDFWKMVIQENVTIIIMVTQFIEQNKEKCYKYFPNNHENMIVGEDIEVRCTMELHFGTYCVRTLQVKKDTTQISVTHMQYLDWPDFNVPNSLENMLQFCYQFRDRLNLEMGCVIVHCSAGVGRTGTLIATDILLQNVRAGKNIDIFNTVLEMRKQRTNMVQTQKQYMYIHNLIKESLQETQMAGLNENMEHVYENVAVLNMKKDDDDNLIAKEKETESQF